MRWVTAASCLLATLGVGPSVAAANAWLVPQMVNAADTTIDNVPTVAMDASQMPWAVWHGYGPYSLAYTRWLGCAWDVERGVGPDAPGVVMRHRPSLAIAAGVGVVVWCNAKYGNTDDIGCSFWADTCWGPEMQVNQPDSTDRDYAPKVACGGGETWCVWYGGPSNVSNYSVFASRWNPGLGEWDPETVVSPLDTCHHWWCDVAVDETGRPHVVWVEVPHYLALYSYWDGARWALPETINDTNRVKVAPWGDTHVALDRYGGVHVSFTGADPGATSRDVYYARRQDGRWDPTWKVSQDGRYNEWYSDIAVAESNDVWVVWQRQGEGSDEYRVYVSRFDGRHWTPECRLDLDATERDEFPAIACCEEGLPWAVWSGTPTGEDDHEIYSSRYATAGLADACHSGGACRASAVQATILVRRNGVVVLRGLAGPVVRIAVFDCAGRTVGSPDACVAVGAESTIRWRADVPSGVYFLGVLGSACLSTYRVEVVE